MAFYKSGAGTDVKYLCSWDYRVGRICDVAFLMRPHMLCSQCSQSQRILPFASPRNKRAKYLILEFLHAREILDVIRPNPSHRAQGNSCQWDPAQRVRATDPGAPGSFYLQVTALETPQQCLGKKRISTSGLGSHLGNKLLLIYDL